MSAKIRKAPMHVTFREGTPPPFERVETAIAKALEPYPIDFLGLEPPFDIRFRFKKAEKGQKGSGQSEAVERSIRRVSQGYLAGLNITWGWRDDVPQEIRDQA